MGRDSIWETHRRLKHDPRIDPLVGDIVRNGGVYGGSFYEVTETGISPHNDLRCVCDGIETQVSINGWRRMVMNAQVIRSMP